MCAGQGYVWHHLLGSGEEDRAEVCRQGEWMVGGSGDPCLGLQCFIVHESARMSDVCGARIVGTRASSLSERCCVQVSLWTSRREAARCDMFTFRNMNVPKSLDTFSSVVGRLWGAALGTLILN